MSGLQGRMMWRLGRRLESLLHHVGIVSTLGSSEDAVVDRLELLYWHLTSSVPACIFLVHITAVTMLI